ncbi:anthranilate phosphoribosyltransferase 1 [Actinoplanes cyaneus]|uniref:Anthranilate phosphoribosyltransferase n=1 Tax=Actinoplanes cyaneus TaxID=52696 RepID=A0A919IKD2_9ACTN|nr:anthranilate phosphoribosyltransferase [Actinoplanes cyaneus]MCW2143186.1 anthranilate phosphoribosyltransferase [Actinoplanes cyaneus]GID67023.1 anthranilate phosphoribosyltransferase 1 [Actinoplanes cyaneus]
MPLSDVILPRLLRRENLTRDEAAWAMTRIVNGEVSPVQVAGFAAALRTKGETTDEISGLVAALQASALPVGVAGPVVDIAGTGGDGLGAVNISTMAAVVAAGTGVRVVKHGGRAASSGTAGAADLVEQLGVRLELGPRAAARVADAAGITFLFGPRFNPGLRHAAAVRRELGVPTVFNVLGPLINPARPRHQVVGVADARMAPLIAGVLAARGGHALVVRGDDGLDKLTTTTTSHVWTVRDGVVGASVLDPATLGLPRARPADLRGATPECNAATFTALLDGQPGPVRDVVLLNAAAMLVAVDGRGFAAALACCVRAVDSGAARATLDRWVRASRREAARDGEPA